MKRILLIAFLLALPIGLSSCGTAGYRSTSPRDNHETNNSPKGKIVGEFAIGTGGGFSRSFLKVKDLWVLEVDFAEGSAGPSVVSFSNRIPQKYLLGIDSHVGQRLLELINDKRPWEWRGFEGDAIANELYFGGKVGTNTWDVKSLYPDSRIGDFVREARKRLRGS